MELTPYSQLDTYGKALRLVSMQPSQQLGNWYPPYTARTGKPRLRFAYDHGGHRWAFMHPQDGGRTQRDRLPLFTHQLKSPE